MTSRPIPRPHPPSPHPPSPHPPSPYPPSPRQPITRRADPALVLLATLAAWQAAHWALGATTLAGPAATAIRLVALAGQGAFQSNAADTAWAFAVAAAISVAGGVALGCALGLARILGQVTTPLLAAFYALPKVTLYPVVLLLFGLGFEAKVAFGIMHGLVPIALLTANAVLQVRPVHLRTARALRLGWPATTWRVILPAIQPQVLAALRTGVPLALLGVLIGEMFASRRGLGALAIQAMDRNDGPTLLAIATLLAAAALGVNAALTALATKA